MLKELLEKLKPFFANAKREITTKEFIYDVCQNCGRTFPVFKHDDPTVCPTCINEGVPQNMYRGEPK